MPRRTRPPKVYTAPGGAQWVTCPNLIDHGVQFGYDYQPGRANRARVCRICDSFAALQPVVTEGSAAWKHGALLVPLWVAVEWSLLREMEDPDDATDAEREFFVRLQLECWGLEAQLRKAKR